MPKRYGDVDKHIITMTSVAFLCLALARTYGSTPIADEDRPFIDKFVCLCDQLTRALQKADDRLSYPQFKYYIEGFRSFKESCGHLLNDNDCWKPAYIQILELFQDMCGEPRTSMTIKRCLDGDITPKFAWSLINGE